MSTDGAKKKILIVDDVPMMRAALAGVFGQLHIPCECLEAGDGVEALRTLAGKKFDLVFLDWNMPELSGIEFLRKVRALKLTVPIIMVTGESDTQNVAQAIRAGVTDYIVKPVTREILREKLAKIGFL